MILIELTNLISRSLIAVKTGMNFVADLRLELSELINCICNLQICNLFDYVN